MHAKKVKIERDHTQTEDEDKSLKPKTKKEEINDEIEQLLVTLKSQRKHKYSK